MKKTEITKLVEGKDNFKDLCTEVLPFIDKINEVIEKFGVKGIANITLSADGYMVFRTQDEDYEMVRVSGKKAPKIRFTYEEEVICEVTACE